MLCIPGKKDGESDSDYVARLAAELDAEFQRVGSDKVCAFIAEPVVGAVSSSSNSRLRGTLFQRNGTIDIFSAGSWMCSGGSWLFPRYEGCLREIRCSSHPR